MPSAEQAVTIAWVVFGLVMAPIAGYIFQSVCNLCGAEPPTFGRPFSPR